MKILRSPFVFWLGLILRANGAWTLVSSENLSADGRGVRHVRVAMDEKETGDEAELQLAICDLRKTTLRVVDQPNESRADLAETMEKERCLAGVNGGYFEANYAPVGLLLSGGHVIAPLRKAHLLSGIVTVEKSRIRLQRTGEFSRKSAMAEALQCGPFLVERGHAIVGLNDVRAARRTFIALGKSNELMLGYCSAVSLAQLAQILVVPVSGAAKVDRALNLDGGSSSAFYFAGDGKPFSIAEQKTVRDFLAVTPK